MGDYIYSVFVAKFHLGDVHKIGDVYVMFLTKTHQGQIKKVDFHIETEDIDDRPYKIVPDEPLRTLSSQSYIINKESEMIHGGDLYETSDTIPIECRYKAIPCIYPYQLIDYTIQSQYDYPFVASGYAEQLSKAIYILVPINATCEHLSDLLIEKVEGDKYYSFNGTYSTIRGTPPGRYVPLTTCPISIGERRDLVFTYNIDSLTSKYHLLNDRLQQYGTSRTQSMVQALKCVSGYLLTETNQFEASEKYDMVVRLVRSLQ